MNTLKAQKLELLEWLAALQDEETIFKLLQWKESHTATSIEVYNHELDAAEAAIARGDYIPHNEATKRLSAWRMH